MPSEQIFQLRIASYNIHAGIGADHRFMPHRIVDVLREIDADIIALQEVESRNTGFDMLEFLASHLHLRGVAGPTLVSDSGDYGNGVLTRLPLISAQRLDLSLPGREARGALDLKLHVGEAQASDQDRANPIRVVATHLGLHPGERRTQVKRLLSVFESDRTIPTIFMGDVNEWFLVGRPLRWLHRHFKRTPAPATFPARFPLFALDRIWVHPVAAVTRIYAHDSALSRRASDHLPIVATLRLFNPSVQIIQSTRSNNSIPHVE